MSERDIRGLLERATVPDREAAEDRAWRVVRAALGDAPAFDPRPTATRRLLRPILVVCLLGGLLIAALTPPGEAVAEWISDVVKPARAPSLTSLPANGRLLVNSTQGPWIVQRDGSQRRLGRYAEAAWSPRGLFVVAARGNQLVALEPNGAVRWALSRKEPISHPAWSPDGFRIAYLSGSTLRVVAGDGTGDAAIGPAGRRAEPSWRPGTAHELAYADRAGHVTVAQTDGRRALWRTGPGAPPRQLLWTPDGLGLVVVSDSSIQIFDPAGRRANAIPLPSGAGAGAAALDPTGRALALVQSRPAASRSEVVVLGLGPGTQPRRLFAGSGRFDDLAWSPDGHWLLVTWPDADQWLFIRSTRVRKVQTVSNVTRQFDPGGRGRSPFPRVSGWCCP